MNNPNRELDADQVVELFAKTLPQHIAQLGADRDWLWFVSAAKPSDEVRTALKHMGFCYTDRPHALPDGREARWYHACNGMVMRRKKGRVSTRQHSTPARVRAEKPGRHNRVAAAESSDAVDELARIADLIP